MTESLTVSLEAIRTDGWFERIGEGIGSFQALCEIVGDRFFAFSIIVGARITALTVDRRSPNQTQVDFVIGAEDDAEAEPQRLSLADFRKRLVGALIVDDGPDHPPPQRETDTEATQLYIGVRYLLLAPVYGYSLSALQVGADGKTTIEAYRDGELLVFELGLFRKRMRAHVHDELDRVSHASRSAIDLARVAEVETFAANREWSKIVQLIGNWPAPLAIFQRTPEGQMLNSDARALIAKGLGILGTACVELGEIDQAEEVLRIAIQYAQEGLAAADIYRRLGDALLRGERPGEAIGPFRRALAFGGAPSEVHPLLAQAFFKRGRYVAAYACVREALTGGANEREVAKVMVDLEKQLGPALTSWKAILIKSARAQTMPPTAP
jgi:tetratricopeptide (TPR) repeat protein